ncbi:hypothetical protein VTG60DRAFT_4690 [Thermothelomyces hinnuleus]
MDQGPTGSAIRAVFAASRSHRPAGHGRPISDTRGSTSEIQRNSARSRGHDRRPHCPPERPQESIPIETQAPGPQHRALLHSTTPRGRLQISGQQALHLLPPLRLSLLQ